ncbi:MAG: GAF domain-containing protein, partial [Actinobacteria bacterium]|nr:GAF domain-containing protein [Actinomycetota bacterium]
MPAQDLGYEAAELLSLSSGEAKALGRLAELATTQVPGCAAAHAAIWRDGELTSVAATHPETAELSELQIRTGRGPLFDAARDGIPVTCTDTLTETRWPEWAEAALLRGVRCAVDLVRQAGPVTLVLALFGVRPGVLAADAVPIAEMIAQLGETALTNSITYDAAQRTATQLKDSVAARAVTDQAKGILM